MIVDWLLRRCLCGLALLTTFALGLQECRARPVTFTRSRFDAGEDWTARGVWLRGWSDQARHWLKESGSTDPQSAQTVAYGDLNLAFGLARLGQRDACLQLLESARKTLRDKDEVHQFLLAAYEYRVLQALENKPHTGPLPARLMESLGRMERLQSYMVERLRKQSWILEPDQRVDPYRAWVARRNDLEKTLAELPDVKDGQEVGRRIERLLADLPEGSEGNAQRARIVQAGLEHAPRVGDRFARQMLTQALVAYDALPQTREEADLGNRATFLQTAMSTATHFRSAEHLKLFTVRLKGLLTAENGHRDLPVLEPAISQCLRGLRKLSMRDDNALLTKQVTDLVLDGKEIESIDFRKRADGAAGLRVLLQAAASWYDLGQATKAQPILEAARRTLLQGDPLPPQQQTLLACAYVRALGHAPPRTAQPRLEDLMKSLRGVRDTYTTSTHFSSSRLDVLEAAVLAMIGEE